MTDNKDINKKLQKIEEQLDAIAANFSISSPHTLPPDLSELHVPSIYGRADEIDLRELFNVLWQGKWWIIGVTFLFAVAGVAYALSLPNMYRSEGIYAPAQKQGGGGLAAQYGGLAAMAGINLGGGENNDINQAVTLITSWPFLEKLINEHNLKSLIMGVKGWNRAANELTWNEDVYDPVNKKWLRNPSPGKLAEPSSYEVYATFVKMISVSFDAKSSMLNVGVEYYSPEVARDWVNLLVVNINEAFRVRDVSEAQKNIAYLESKVQQTSIAEMQSVFYGMVEVQMKKLMLAEVDDEYLIKTIVMPKISELKSAPNRKIILILAVFAGCLISMGGVFVSRFLIA